MIELLLSPSAAEYVKTHRQSTWLGALSMSRVVFEQYLARMGLVPHASWLKWDDAIRELTLSDFELGTSSMLVSNRAKQPVVERHGKPAAIIFGRCNHGWLYLEPDGTVLITSFRAGAPEVFAESPLKLIERIPRLAGTWNAPLRMRVSPVSGARIAEGMSLSIATSASDSVQTIWEGKGVLVIDDGLGDVAKRVTTVTATDAATLAEAIRIVAGAGAKVHIDAPMAKAKHAALDEAPPLPEPDPEETARVDVASSLDPLGGIVRIFGRGKTTRIEQLETACGRVIGRVEAKGRTVSSTRFDQSAAPFGDRVSAAASKKLAKKGRVDLRLRMNGSRLRAALGARAFGPVVDLEERYGGVTLLGDEEGAETVFGAYAYRTGDPLGCDDEVVATNGRAVVPVGSAPNGWYFMDEAGCVYYQDEVTHAHPVRIAASIEKVFERLGGELSGSRSAAWIDVPGEHGEALAKRGKLRRSEALSDDAEAWWVGPKLAVRQCVDIMEGYPVTSLFGAKREPLVALLDAEGISTASTPARR